MNDCIISMRAKFNTGKRRGFGVLFIARRRSRRCYCAVIAKTNDCMNDSGGRMDVSKIDSMLAQLRAGAALASGKPARFPLRRLPREA